MQSIEIISGDFSSQYYDAYLSFVSKNWSSDRYYKSIDTQLPVKILFFIYSGKCIGGVTLTSYIANTLKDELHINMAQDFADKGYANLTYLVIDESLRGQKMGSRYMQEIIHMNIPFWPTARERRYDFYARLGLVEYMQPTEKQPHYILVSK